MDIAIAVMVPIVCVICFVVLVVGRKRAKQRELIYLRRKALKSAEATTRALTTIQEEPLKRIA
jgi:hypothetical protein